LKDFKHLSRKSQPPATKDISAHPTTLENSGDGGKNVKVDLLYRDGNDSL